ncbi:DUF6985 domain-containing protein [Devosia lacusdianchii]|jgi:hypothetical protein|uniref:DUF6985 domain-containing protein n=1 Tax=Devosia lacusdianchii TaxID=2917991 RepID=UPI001F0588EF|nr:hypothetical protein [Devosia sp. JXJ CY 41]
MFKVPYFDNAEMETIEAVEDAGAAAALAAFVALTPADRLADARHVFAYYKDYHQAVGGEDWLDEQMGVPETPADIWRHVTPGGEIAVEKGRKGDDNWYVVMEANCAWEEEHGLMLVWRNGTTLTKVGGYDGHLTNVNAYADDSLVDVVYAASDPTFTTRLGDVG